VSNMRINSLEDFPKVMCIHEKMWEQAEDGTLIDGLCTTMHYTECTRFCPIMAEQIRQDREDPMLSPYWEMTNEEFSKEFDF